MVDKNNKIKIQNQEYKTGDIVKFNLKGNNPRYVKEITSSRKQEMLFMIVFLKQEMK